MAVLIPFTGGVESTYLVQKALAEGHKVIVAYYGITQHGRSRMSELTARRHMIEYWKNKYPNKVIELYGYFENICFIPTPQRMEKNGVRQQWNVINQIVATISSLNVKHDVVSSVWIGWTQYDTAEHSLSYTDLTSDEYIRLTQLVPEILFLSNVDKSLRTPFMPLWHEKSKVDVYNKIDDDLRPFIIANGQSDAFRSTPEAIFHIVNDTKIDEYRDLPINTVFPRIRLNYLEQAMIDAFCGSGFVRKETSGYADLFDGVPDQHIDKFSEIISAYILSQPDKIHLFDSLYQIEFNEKVQRYANTIKFMTGWTVPEVSRASSEEDVCS